MQKNLVIVESPAKAKTIEKFLGDDYKVMSSYGHIRDLKKRELSIDDNTMEPEYEIPDEKKKLVSELKSQAKKASQVWLASDEDREGEAISWHLCEVLGLDEQKTKRIVFHEITKPAILAAIEHPRTLDMNLVNAQQARRVLDRLVGFKLSPVLWRKVKPALSAGRVQSVAVRLIVERERELQAFKSETYYSVSATFGVVNADGSQSEVKATLGQRFKSQQEAEQFLELCKDATFTIEQIQKKPQKRVPAPPFTTSTLQQEAARKLGFTVSQTMMVAQHLYESGRITYMRTDSVNLSSLAINSAKDKITELYGGDYSKVRQYHTSSKGAQEAHEAIRPTYMDQTTIEGTVQERRLYDLIWKRTAASQMADAEIEKTTVTIRIENGELGTERYDNSQASTNVTNHTSQLSTLNSQFVATGEVVKFDGFLKVYRESQDDDDENTDEFAHVLPPLHEGQELIRREIMPESLWVYQFDIRKFYDNIDHGCLKSALEHKIKDRRLLELLFIIIDCFPCSGYLQQHPTASRDRGIPIGNIVSPLFSNFLLSDLDHWAKEQFKAAGYYRYADDVVALLRSKDQARDFRTAVHERISALKLTIKPTEQIYPFRARPIDFIGYVVSPYTIRLRKRIERRLRRCIRLYHTKRSQHLAASVASRWGWVKHISHAGRLWFTLTNKTASNIIKEAQSC